MCRFPLRGRWAWTLLILALAAASDARRACAQFQGRQPGAARPASRFYPDTRSSAHSFFRSAEGNVANAQWPEAIELYQRVIREFGDSVAQVSQVDPADPAGASEIYVDTRQYCHRRIAALPPEARSLYRRRVDGQAEQWFKAGLAARDRTLLRRVIEEAFCSSYGDDALEALGDLAFRAGRFGEALGYYRQLVGDPGAVEGVLVHPDPSVDLARIAAKKLLCRAAAGESVPTKDDLDAYAQEYAKAQGDFAGRSGALSESLAKALSEDHLTARSALDGGWTTFAGSPRRTRTAAGAIDVGSLQWKARLNPITAPKVSATVFNGRQFVPASMPLRPDRGLAYFPIVIGEQVIVCDSERLFAYNLGDRPTTATIDAEPKLAWEQVLQNGFAGSPSRFPGTPRFTVTAYGDRVFARLGSPTARPGPSFLMAVRNNREVEGKLLWMLPASEVPLPRRPAAGAGPGRVAVFEGTPVADARNVYVGLTETGTMNALYVACLDAETRATRWVRYLGEASSIQQDMGMNGFADDSGNRLLSLDGGTLYYQTNMGAVAALDAETGAVRWLATYANDPRAGRFGLGRDLNPAIVHDGLVIVAPDDTNAILAFDAATGRLAWRASIGDAGRGSEVTHLLGVAQGRLFATGGKVWSFDVKTGKLLTLWPDTGVGMQGFGRGLLAGGYVYWPTKTEIVVLDQATGRKAERESIALQQVFGTTGGNLAVGDGYLVVATEDSLVVFCENSRLIDRYKEMIVAAPREASNYVRLARVAEATGQDDLALESLGKALEVARTAELLDGQPLAEVAASQRFRLVTRLANQAVSAGAWPEAVRRFEAAVAAAGTDRDRLGARLMLADALDKNGEPRAAVALLQELMSDERLRALTVAADERRTVRADLLIADRLEALLKSRGRALYDDYEQTARKLLAEGAARKDPRLLEEIGRSYPAAGVVAESLLTLGALHEQRSEPEAAARAYKRLLAAAGDNTTRARALLGLGRAYEAQGYWVPARDAYAHAQARFPNLTLDDSRTTVGALVAARLSKPPFNSMTGDRSEPSLPLPLGRSWSARWTGSIRPIAAEGVPPSTGSGRILIADGATLRPIDPASGRYGWSADLGEEPVWVGYLTDSVLAATAHRLVALDLKTGVEHWHFDAGDPRPARRAANPFARPTGHQVGVEAAPPSSRLEGFQIVGGRLFFRRGDRELIALDGETGQIDWSFAPAAKGTLNPHMWIGFRQIVLQVHNPNAVVLLDTDSGVPRAEFPQSEQEDSWRRDPLPIDDEHVALVTDPRTVVLFDLTRGIASWTYREPSALPRSGPPRLLGDSGRLLVLRDGSELVRLDPASGRKLWSRLVSVEDLSEWSEGLALDGDRVYVATGRTLTAFSLADGEVAWRRYLTGALTGWCVTLSDRSVIAYPSPARSLDDNLAALPVVVLKRDSGRLIQRLRFPGAVTALAVRLAPGSMLVATQEQGWALGLPALADTGAPPH